MRKSTAPGAQALLQPRVRIRLGQEIAIGPGKADLLAHIHATGSLTTAAREMGLSYMRAWTMVKTMNACFRQPVVEATRGGRQGGGAHLTETGEAVLNAYRKMEAACQKAGLRCWPDWKTLLRN